MQVDELQRALQFVSISSDGSVVLWTLTKSELQKERLMRLQPAPQQEQLQAVVTEAADEHSGLANAGGLCMDFNKVGIEQETMGCGWHVAQCIGSLCMECDRKGGCAVNELQKEQLQAVVTEAADEHSGLATAGGLCMDFTKVGGWVGR